MNRNEKIIEMNSKLFDLDEQKKKLDSEEKKTKEELSNIKDIYESENKKSKLSFKLFIVSLGLIFINSYNLSKGVFVLPKDIIPRVALSGLSFTGSLTAWLHYTNIADGFLFKTFDLESELSRIHSYQNELKETRALVYEKLHSHQNEEYLDEINSILDKNVYLNEVINNNTKDKPKTRTLTNNRSKH